MKVVICTFADLGERTNLKTVDILPVINKFAKEGKLHQIICRIRKNFYFKNTQSAIPLYFHYLIEIFERFFPIFSSRKVEENILDCFVSKQMSDFLVFFHPDFIFIKSVSMAKRSGACSVGIAVGAHPTVNAALVKEEFSLLGLQNYARGFQKIQKKVDHLKQFDYFIAISDFVRKTYVEDGIPAEKIYVAYTDIAKEKFVPGEKRDNVFRVLYVAHTTPLKGLHYLFEAWNMLNLKNSELVLVGDFRNNPKILTKKCIKTINSNPSIKWVDFSKEVEKWYQQSSVFVLPSLTEGNPRAVMEAMACGLPVITTENAQSIVKDGKNGFVIPIRDQDAIKEKIEFLYYNPDIAEKMGKEARQAIENKKDFGEAVFEIYQEILKREGIKK